jgi:hypothetical protein
MTHPGCPQRHGVEITYRGLFLCGGCGCSLTGEFKKGKYTYYRCTRMRGPCAQPPIREEALEEQISGLLKPLAQEDGFIAQVRSFYDEATSEARERQQAERAGLTERAEKLRGYINASYEDKLEGRIPVALWERKSREWNDELAAIERRLAASPTDHGDPALAIKAFELAKRTARAMGYGGGRRAQIARRKRMIELGSARPNFNPELEIAL